MDNLIISVNTSKVTEILNIPEQNIHDGKKYLHLYDTDHLVGFFYFQKYKMIIIYIILYVLTIYLIICIFIL